jgi:hypothetical protein
MASSSGPSISQREDRAMAINRTRRTIGLSAFLILAAMGTGWALAKTSSVPANDRPAVSEPARDDTRRPDIQPAATDSEYDRSDLLLSLG